MAVPKRKVSKCRRNLRHANKGLKPKAFSVCKNCEEPISPHQACLSCGFYKGTKIMATKADRGLKRAETRKGKMAAKAAAEKQAVESEEKE